MQNINSKESRALRARGLVGQWAMLAIGFSAAAWSGEALAWTGQPLAYVANSASDSISVIDTGDNTVVDTIRVGNGPNGIAVAPDGKTVYVTVSADNNLSVIDTTTNKVVRAPISVGTLPVNVAVTPDGKRAFVANFGSFPNQNGSVSVIDTASNAVVATIMVPLNSFGHAFGVAITPDGKYAYVTVQQFVADSQGGVFVIDTSKNTVVTAVSKPQSVWIDPQGVAITPDGKYAYVTNYRSGGVSVIDTATNTVVGSPIPVIDPSGVAITADGKHAYVTDLGSGSVSVIETGDNKVVSTVPLPAGANPAGITLTPDGTRVYVANDNSNNVSVIQRATNKVVGNPISVGTFPVGVGIIPPPQGVQFLSLSAKLDIHAAKRGEFDLRSEFTLSSTASNGIHPESEPVRLQVGPFITTIPAGSFKHGKDGLYTFRGVIDRVWLEAQIKPTGALRYAFDAVAIGANLSGTTNPVQVSLSIGKDAGLTSVKAHFDRDHQALGD